MPIFRNHPEIPGAYYLKRLPSEPRFEALLGVRVSVEVSQQYVSGLGTGSTPVTITIRARDGLGAIINANKVQLLLAPTNTAITVGPVTAANPPQEGGEYVFTATLTVALTDTPTVEQTLRQRLTVNVTSVANRSGTGNADFWYVTNRPGGVTVFSAESWIRGIRLRWETPEASNIDGLIINGALAYYLIRLTTVPPASAPSLTAAQARALIREAGDPNYDPAQGYPGGPNGQHAAFGAMGLDPRVYQVMGNSYVDPVREPFEFHYWLVSVDLFGNLSSLSNRVAAIPGYVEDTDFEQGSVDIARIAERNSAANAVAAGSVTTTKLGVLNAAFDPEKFRSHNRLVNGAFVAQAQGSQGYQYIAWKSLKIVVGDSPTVTVNSPPDGELGVSTGLADHAIVWLRNANTLAQYPRATYLKNLKDQNLEPNEGYILLGFNREGKFIQSISGTVIRGDTIETGTILADRLDVNQLSAISANLGEIETGIIRDDARRPDAVLRLSSTKAPAIVQNAAGQPYMAIGTTTLADDTVTVTNGTASFTKPQTLDDKDGILVGGRLLTVVSGSGTSYTVAPATVNVRFTVTSGGSGTSFAVTPSNVTVPAGSSFSVGTTTGTGTVRVINGTATFTSSQTFAASATFLAAVPTNVTASTFVIYRRIPRLIDMPADASSALVPGTPNQRFISVTNKDASNVWQDLFYITADGRARFRGNIRTPRITVSNSDKVGDAEVDGVTIVNLPVNLSGPLTGEDATFDTLSSDQVSADTAVFKSALVKSGVNGAPYVQLGEYTPSPSGSTSLVFTSSGMPVSTTATTSYTQSVYSTLDTLPGGVTKPPLENKYTLTLRPSVLVPLMVEPGTSVPSNLTATIIVQQRLGADPAQFTTIATKAFTVSAINLYGAYYDYDTNSVQYYSIADTTPSTRYGPGSTMRAYVGPSSLVSGTGTVSVSVVGYQATATFSSNPGFSRFDWFRVGNADYQITEVVGNGVYRVSNFQLGSFADRTFEVYNFDVTITVPVTSYAQSEHPYLRVAIAGEGTYLTGWDGFSSSYTNPAVTYSIDAASINFTYASSSDGLLPRSASIMSTGGFLYLQPRALPATGVSGEMLFDLSSTPPVPKYWDPTAGANGGWVTMSGIGNAGTISVGDGTITSSGVATLVFRSQGTTFGVSTAGLSPNKVTTVTIPAGYAAATSTVLGVVKVPTTGALLVDSAGAISINVGTGLNIGTDGKLNATGSLTTTGTVTADYVPKWFSSTQLTNSRILDNATGIGIGGVASASYLVNITGGLQASSDSKFLGKLDVVGKTTVGSSFAGPATGAGSAAPLRIQGVTNLGNYEAIYATGAIFASDFVLIDGSGAVSTAGPSISVYSAGALQTAALTALRFTGSGVTVTQTPGGNTSDLTISITGGSSGLATSGTAEPGVIPKFTGSPLTLTNSIISDNGATVTVGGALVVTGAASLRNSLNLTGNINFDATSGRGLVWNMNTDGAFIKFVSSSDAAGQSYLEVGTTDNGDEPIKFTQTGSLRALIDTDGLLKNGASQKYLYENNGTWGINISGTAGSLTNGSDYMAYRGSVNAPGYTSAAYDAAVLNGFYTISNPNVDSRAALVFNATGSAGPVQMEFAYTGLFRWRNKTDSSVWTGWRTLLNDTNYADYAVKLDGSNVTAGNTWGISISGNAATATTAAKADKVANALTAGAYLTGGTYDGSVVKTFAVEADTANTFSKIVARDASGHIYVQNLIAVGQINGGTSTGTSSHNLYKAAHAVGSSNAHLELYAHGDNQTAAGEVSMRFSQGSKFWYQLRASTAGFKFTEGNSNALANVTAGVVYANDFVLLDGSGQTASAGPEIFVYKQLLGTPVNPLNKPLTSLRFKGTGVTDVTAVDGAVTVDISGGTSGLATSGTAEAGVIPKFIGSPLTLTNSIISDNGAVVTVGGALTATGVITSSTGFNGPQYSTRIFTLIGNYADNSTWFIRQKQASTPTNPNPPETAYFVWGRAHDWTVSFGLDLTSGTGGANSAWATFGQTQSNVAAGTWRGVRIMQYKVSAATDGDLRAARYYLGDDTNYITQGAAGAIRSQTETGYLDMGSMNSGWAHFQTDRPAFYFNKSVSVDGELYRYSGNYKYLHEGNYTDFVPSKTGAGASGNWNISVSGTTFSGGSTHQDDISERINSGFYQSDKPTMGGGWPVNWGEPYNYSWHHLLSVTHSNPNNYYAMQIAGDFYAQNFYIRNTNGTGQTGWKTLIHSGNISAYAPSFSGTGAFGTWGISITGRAVGSFVTPTTSGTADWNHVSNTRPGTGSTLLLGSHENGPGPASYYHPLNLEYTSSDGTGNVTQMAVAYGSPGNQLWMRGRYANAWTGWTQFLNTNNYSNYALPLTGGTLTGTLRIDRQAHAINSNNYYIELYSPVGTEAGEVSIRFHQSNRYYHQIRATIEGFRLTGGISGALSNLTAGTIYANDFVLLDGTGSTASAGPEIGVYNNNVNALNKINPTALSKLRFAGTGVQSVVSNGYGDITVNIAGGGISMVEGTSPITDRLPKFASASTFTNSIFSDNGTTATVAGSLTVTGSQVVGGSMSVASAFQAKSVAEGVVSTDVYTSSGNGGTLTLTFSSGTTYVMTRNYSFSGFSITGAPSGAAGSMTLILMADGNAWSSSWGGVKWANGVAPTLSSTSGKYDILSFVLVGGQIFGFVAGLGL